MTSDALTTEENQLCHILHVNVDSDTQIIKSRLAPMTLHYNVR